MGSVDTKPSLETESLRGNHRLQLQRGVGEHTHTEARAKEGV